MKAFDSLSRFSACARAQPEQLEWSGRNILRKPMEHLSPEVLATVVAEKFGDSYGGIISAAMREDLARRVERALLEAVVADRKPAAAICLDRQALWEAAEARPATPDPLRAEARARANEAAYLADAVQCRP
ncbi:MAG TPA: hypothetical protein VHO67_16290 [Polyangia bacterium]|nr:hypothetical protein [Polyangia bacterium]